MQRFSAARGGKNALLVGFEQMDRARTVVAAPAARDAPASVESGRLKQGNEGHRKSTGERPVRLRESWTDASELFDNHGCLGAIARVTPERGA
jgi:hypothetical protein